MHKSRPPDAALASPSLRRSRNDEDSSDGTEPEKQLEARRGRRGRGYKTARHMLLGIVSRLTFADLGAQRAFQSRGHLNRSPSQTAVHRRTSQATTADSSARASSRYKTRRGCSRVMRWPPPKATRAIRRRQCEARDRETKNTDKK